MLNLNSLLLSSEDVKKLASFYEKVLEKKPDMDEGGYIGFLAGKTFLTLGPHEKVNGKSPNPERMIFNFETTDVKKEFERIKDIGGKVVAKPYQMGDSDMWIATFADPDGNYFQLATPWEEEN